MTREDAIKTAYENDTHPYSINAMTEMLLKGAEIGRMEAIDDVLKWIEDNKYDVNDFAYDFGHEYMVVDVDSLITYINAMEE